MPERFHQKAPIPVYHEGVRCPACTGTNWHIGRKVAECGKCAYPLHLSHRQGEVIDC